MFCRDGAVADGCLLTDNNIRPPSLTEHSQQQQQQQLVGLTDHLTSDPTTPTLRGSPFLDCFHPERQNPILRLPGCKLKFSSAFPNPGLGKSPRRERRNGELWLRPLRATHALRDRLESPWGAEGRFMTRLDSKYLLEMCCSARKEHTSCFCAVNDGKNEKTR